MGIIKLNHLLLLLVVLCTLSACSSPPEGIIAGIQSTRVVVTRDFGKTLILDETVDLPEKSPALEALKKVAQVETAFGGGFVKGINGLRSENTKAASSKQDWFVFFNGMLANTGAADYTLQPGDTQQWDYHTWSFHQMIPAVTGHFPQPMSQGYAGKTRTTLIAYGAPFREEAVSLQKLLLSLEVRSLELREISGLSAKEKSECNILLLDTCKNGLISELNQKWRRLGFFAHFDNDKLMALTAEGKIKENYGAGTGWIQPTQNPWNPNGAGADENVVWLLTGTDETGVKAAVRSLIKNYSQVQFACALIVSGDEIIRLPL